MYPLFFTYREVVNGAGFIAGVQIRGLALMTHENNDWVMTGVHPGCFTEVGDTFEEARLHFRGMFRGILFDIAEETTDYDGFEAHVRKILGQVNEPAMAIWKQAVAAVRENEIELTGEVEDLERRFAGLGFELQVDRFNKPEVSTADSNQSDEYYVAEAEAA